MVDSRQLILVSLVLLSNIQDTLLLILKIFNLKTKKKEKKKEEKFKNCVRLNTQAKLQINYEKSIIIQPILKFFIQIYSDGAAKNEKMKNDI